MREAALRALKQQQTQQRLVSSALFLLFEQSLSIMLSDREFDSETSGVSLLVCLVCFG